jgi:hypothetical protein
MKLTVGILIIGSLHWSTQPHREFWRDRYLQKGTDVVVKVPIRYGRLSSTNTYTMVFGRGCEMGEARVFECKSTISSIGELVREAQALWLAESRDGTAPQPSETLSAGWGCVTLLANDQSNVPQSLLDQWAERVSQERFGKVCERSYDHRRYSVKGLSAITDRGGLAVDWPNRADTGKRLAGFGLLLATATRPTPHGGTGDFAPVDVIAEAWNEREDATYFHSNRANGFHTFQDGAIAALLRV